MIATCLGELGVAQPMALGSKEAFRDEWLVELFPDCTACPFIKAVTM